ncbi:hypothetical protein [Thermocatellispora tengchongensis]|uniref:hypothetical protein n=1 Tax=Thermocatellispora tengchongensis TaxID=1073253 RepID=UPI003636ADEC
MPAHPWLRITLVAASAGALALSATGVAQSQPVHQVQSAESARQAPKVHDFQAEEHGKPDLDHRKGAVAPPAALRSGAGTTIRWNTLGTPAVITAAGPLAEGLGGDPEQAARAYLKANQALFGLSAEAVDALEKVAVNPIGQGHAVLLRQRFGDLPAGVDGLVALGVADGKIMHVTSTLSRTTEARRPRPSTSSGPWRSPRPTGGSTWPRRPPSWSRPSPCPRPTACTTPSRSH